MPYTLANAREFLRDNNLLDSSTRGQRTELRLCNMALAELRLLLGSELESDRKKTALSFAAAVSSPGKVKFSTSTTLIGTSATTFGSEVIGRLIYIGNELRPRLISNYAAPGGVRTLTISTAYTGSYDSSDTTTELAFYIADERKALPSDFRRIDAADNGSLLYYLDALTDVSEIDKIRSRISHRQEPAMYAVEFADVSTERTAYLRLYPAPVVKTEIDLWYYGGPALFTAGSETTQTFGLPSTPEAELVIEKYLLALLLQHQRDAEWTTRMAEAKACANAYKLRTQPVNADGPRARYGVDERQLPFRARFADGLGETV